MASVRQIARAPYGRRSLRGRRGAGNRSVGRRPPDTVQPLRATVSSPRANENLGTPDADLRLVQPRASALRTLARFRELLFIESEPAGSTAGGDNEDLLACGSGRPKRVTEIVLDVTALEAKLAGQPRHRPWLGGQKRQQIRTK